MTNIELLRRHLDKRVEPLRAVAPAKPVRGWIRAIREGLGMTTGQLADRIGVSQPRIVAIEHAEAKGAINLRTLQRAARALDCELVYALVPRQPLEKVVQDRAMSVAAEQVKAVEHTMGLEDQAVGEETDTEGRIREQAAKLLRHNDHSIWRK